MANVRAVECDGPSCDAMAKRDDDEGRPAGWIEVTMEQVGRREKRKRRKELLFCSGQCTAEYAMVVFPPPQSLQAAP